MTNWKSGCSAGILSAVCLQPFDVLKTYSIVSSRESSGMLKGIRLVMEKYGIKGMWRGVSPAVTRAFFGSGSYFLFLEELKYLSGSTHFLSNGACSGLSKFIVTCLCLPISVIKVRMESPTCQVYTGMLNGVSQIYSTEGMKGFYRGLTPTLIKEIPYSSLGYAFYELYIEIFTEITLRDRSSPVITFIAGVLAGFTATVTTQPFDVIKTKIQFQKYNVKGYSNMIETIKAIYYEDGVLGFQRGLLPRISKRFFSFPLVWTLYEQFRLTF